MEETIESAIEVLVGIVPRKLNIRLDPKDRSILKSIGNQISKNIGLTDRQIEMIVRKIEKYRYGLEANFVPVDEILKNQSTRYPIRIIDRSETIKILNDKEKNIDWIFITHQKTKNFEKIWLNFRERLIGEIEESFSQKKIILNDVNLRMVLDELSEFEFNIDSNLTSSIEEIEKITKNTDNYIPRLDIVEDRLEIKNNISEISKKISSSTDLLTTSNFLKTLSYLKTHKISLKSPKILEKLKELYQDQDIEIAMKIIFSNSSRIRVAPENVSIKELLKNMILVDHYPILVVLDENNQALEKVKEFVECLKCFFTNDEMTVFFRLPNLDKDFRNFSNFVKENKLNNFIDEKTKVVFISKQRVPKPLIRSTWKPTSAIVLTNNDYGKISVYLNDFLNVYYYNDSMSLRKLYNRRYIEIDQL